jgi:hypothetical protein
MSVARALPPNRVHRQSLMSLARERLNSGTPVPYEASTDDLVKNSALLDQKRQDRVGGHRSALHDRNLTKWLFSS